MKDKKKNKIPDFKSDKEAEEFIAKEDLTNYDLSAFKPISFEFEKKSKAIKIRMPEGLLRMVKAKAKALNIPYTRYIREVLEKDLKT